MGHERTLEGIADAPAALAVPAGSTWLPPVTLSPAEFDGHRPRVALDRQGGAVVVWLSPSPPETGRRPSHPVDTSTGYAHHEGWEALAQVFTWSVPTDELKRSFDAADFEITHGASPPTRLLQRELATRWNGPLLRPEWWDRWKQDKHSLTSYRFNRPGELPTGLLSLAFGPHPTDGTRVVVHDFWADNDRVAAAMFAFLGRHNSRIRTVEFQRTGLPPHPLLLHNLHRVGSAAAQSWHPWMLRVLDVKGAVRLRGWPADLDITIPMEVGAESGEPPERFTLRIVSGAGELAPTTREGRVQLTRRQFAVWYAGGYRTTTAATMAGVCGDPSDLAMLVLATGDREPWLPDHF